MGKSNHRKFKNYLIHKDFQIRIILYSLLFIGLITTFTIAITLSPYVNKMVHSTVLEEQMAAAETYMLLLKLIPGIFVLSVIFLFTMVFFTHRLCGPLVNFLRSFEAGVKGDLTHKVHLRKNDYLKEESSVYNEMIDNLTLKLMSIKRNSKEVQALLNGIIEETDKPDRIEGNTIAEKANNALKSTEMVVEEISFFKLPEDSDRREPSPLPE